MNQGIDLAERAAPGASDVTASRKMHFEPSAYPAEIPALFQRFLTIADGQLWDRRSEEFRHWHRDNPLIDRLIESRYPIEVAMTRARARGDDPTGLTSALRDPANYYLASFMSMVARVHQRLSPTGKRRMEGIIRGGLKDDGGLLKWTRFLGPVD